ncbi:hypothetical protein BT96DRAFT_913564 [Gymnopus androsaceus JB14]|uniref:F-box domain-containing protein n=1 Tax=Gymnopus androsaceus JB14 TaxID=1447944 RepID=A0A6A4IE38_9AGAR|nr:hypothetical protein BT96DRAFT_913564 [Gymnopus androsaceus JB14]
MKLTLPAIAYLPTLAISAVCTRWRSLTLASPSLWSHLRLETAPDRIRTVLDMQAHCQGGFMSTLQLYLDRSVDTPLMIGLQTTGTLKYSDSTPPALNLLLQHTCRWRTFSYIGDYRLTNCMGLSLSFPILENLSLNGLRSTLDCFANAPKLRAVRTNDLEIHSNFPWTQLTSLDIRPSGGGDIDFLHRCPRLTVLKLQRSSWLKLGPGSVFLASLESFTFNDFIGQLKTLEDMFYIFTFPSLGELIVCSKDSFGANRVKWPPDAFSAFISRSSCTLTTLSLRNITISDVNLIAALRLVPSLTTFSIDGLMNSSGGSPITSHLLWSLTYHGFDSALLPKLRFLSMKLRRTSFDDAAFVRMVSSRWMPDHVYAAAIGIACLRSLVLHFAEREVDKGAYRPLFDLDRKGMRVVIAGTEMKGTKV